MNLNGGVGFWGGCGGFAFVFRSLAPKAHQGTQEVESAHQWNR